MATTASPASATGIGRSASTRSSGPPRRVQRMAFTGRPRAFVGACGFVARVGGAHTALLERDHLPKRSSQRHKRVYARLPRAMGQDDGGKRFRTTPVHMAAEICTMGLYPPHPNQGPCRRLHIAEF